MDRSATTPSSRERAGTAAPRAGLSAWAARLRTVLAFATYRPERHYMRGSRAGGPASGR